jgi:copper(I)-binding protein
VIRSGWGSGPLRRLLLVSAAAVIPVLAGCEAGNNAPTLNFHYPTDAAGTVVGDLSIRNVFVLGAPLGSSLTPGQSASLFFAVVNTGSPDRLISITAPGTATTVTLPGGSIPLGTARTVLLTGPQAQAVLVNLTRTVTSGSVVKLVLDFQKEGTVTLQVPVFARAAHYTTYSPPPSPSPTPTPTRHAHRHGAGSATPTPSPSLTPAATPSPTTS